MNKTQFERLVHASRVACLEVLEDIKNIANGTLTYYEMRVVDGQPQQVECQTKPSDRIAAAKLLKDIVMNKEALQVKDTDELDLLSPFEKRKILYEALEECEEEIRAIQ